MKHDQDPPEDATEDATATGEDPAFDEANRDHVVHLVRLQGLLDATCQRHYRAGEDGQAKHVGVFLQHDARDLLGRPPQSGIDHLHPGVAQRLGNHADAAIMAVQADLGEHHPDRSAVAGRRRGRLGLCWDHQNLVASGT